MKCATEQASMSLQWSSTQCSFPLWWSSVCSATSWSLSFWSSMKTQIPYQCFHSKPDCVGSPLHCRSVLLGLLPHVQMDFSLLQWVLQQWYCPHPDDCSPLCSCHEFFFWHCVYQRLLQCSNNYHDLGCEYPGCQSSLPLHQSHEHWVRPESLWLHEFLLELVGNLPAKYFLFSEFSGICFLLFLDHIQYSL